MSTKNIQLYIEGKVATLQFQRLNKLNAINFEMVKQMRAELSRIDTSKINVLFLKGHPEAFSAGGDLKEMQKLKRAEAEEQSKFISETFTAIKSLDIPSVAFISGFCYGGGLEISLNCDYRICSTSAQFAFPEVKYGILPGAGGTVLFPQTVGVANAAYYMLTGEVFNSEQALKMNVAQKVVNINDFELEIQQQTKFYNNANSESLKAIKNQLKLNYNTKNSAYKTEAKYFAELLSKFAGKIL